jgi:multidrug efflux system outer membrane protein
MKTLSAKTLSVISAAALLAGCTLAPHYLRPAPPVPSTWPSGPAYAPAEAASQTAADLAWREVFTDPKLQAVIDRALSNNRDLRVAILNVQATRAQFQVQRAALFPSLTGTAGLAREHVPGAAFGIPGGGSVDTRLYSVTGGITNYEVDLFGRVRSLTEASFEQYLASTQARHAAQISLIAETATAWLTLAADRDRLAVAQHTLQSQNHSLAVAEGRFKAGIASEIDLRQAQTTVDTARAAVANYTTQCAQDLNALEVLTGSSLPEDLLPVSLDGPSPVLETLPAGLSSDVLLRRPDVLQAEHQLRAMNADIGAARAAFFPSMTLTATGGAEATGLSHLFTPGSTAWTFIPNLTQPIWDWGANRGKLRYAKAQRDIAVAQYEKAIQTAFRETADALARRGTIGEDLAANQANVEANSASLRLTVARYQKGVDPYLNTLVAEQNLYTAQQSLVTAKLAYFANLVSLYEALGGGVK